MFGGGLKKRGAAAYDQAAEWLHEPEPEPVRNGRQGDLLAEERHSARGLRRLSGFVSAPGGKMLSGLAVIVFLGVAFTLPGRLGWTAGDGAEPVFAPREVPAAAGAGGRTDFSLTGADYGMAAGYGRAVGVGASGRPLVALDNTGETRELTAVEAEFGRGDSVKEVEGKANALWNPGPRGLGLWWNVADPVEQAFQPTLGFSRQGWRERQQREMTYALTLIGGSLEALELAASSDQEMLRWSEDLQKVTGYPRLALGARHPPAELGQWAHVPVQWQCDRQLEVDLKQGLTVGCPLPETVAALQEVWVQIGLVSERLHRFAALGGLWNEIGGREALSSELPAEQSYALFDLARSVEKLERALEVLSAQSQAENLPLWGSVF